MLLSAYQIFIQNTINSLNTYQLDCNKIIAKGLTHINVGLQLVYELASPVTYTFSAVQIRTLLGLNNIWTDTGDITNLVYYIDNQNISEHNYELSVTFTGEDNIWFVNPGTALQTGDGGLNPDYSGGDGIHLGGAAYDIMLEEIYSFVINSGI